MSTARREVVGVEVCGEMSRRPTDSGKGRGSSSLRTDPMTAVQWLKGAADVADVLGCVADKTVDARKERATLRHQ